MPIEVGGRLVGRLVFGSELLGTISHLGVRHNHYSIGCQVASTNALVD
jgi:hypothetical protein